jgi:hypothetical protein
MKIQEILGDVWTKIDPAVQKEIESKAGTKDLIEASDKMIPKERLDQEIAKVKDLKEQVTAKDAQLAQVQEDLKKVEPLVKDHEAAKAKINELQTSMETTKAESEKRIKEMTVSDKIKTDLRAEGLTEDAIELLLPHVNRDTVVISADMKTATGIKEQLPDLSKRFPVAFLGKAQNSGPGFKPGESGRQKNELDQKYEAAVKEYGQVSPQAIKIKMQIQKDKQSKGEPEK